MKHITKYFINGIIVLLPIVVTWLLISKILAVIEDAFGIYSVAGYPGVGLLTAIVLIFLVGWMSSNILLKRVLDYVERMVEHIPVVKFIYKNVKKLSSAVLSSEKLLQHAVLVPYPHPEIKALGFLMSELSEPVQECLSEEHVCVFVPMSLNPTAGVNIIVPKKDIIRLDVSVESAFEYVVTAGTVMPVRADS